MPELASPDTEHGRDVRPICDGRELLGAALPKRGDEQHSIAGRVAGAVMLCHASRAAAMAARIGLALAVLTGPGVPPAAGQTEADHPGIQLVGTDRFLQPHEAYDKTIAMLRAPSHQGTVRSVGRSRHAGGSRRQVAGPARLGGDDRDLGPDTAAPPEVERQAQAILKLLGKPPADVPLSAATASA